jgi:hypothetical protein
MEELNSKPRVVITALRNNPTLSAAKELLQKYPLNNFEIAEAIAEAEVILYLENGYIGLMELRQLLARVESAPSAMHFLFVESDWPFPVLPGAYPSLTRSYPWAQGWSFLPQDGVGRKDGQCAVVEPEFLFSFLGRTCTHPVRKAIVLLDKNNSPCLDVANGPNRFPDFDFAETYSNLIKRSKFVLCPRGFGVSSIRIFETMCSGRVPVIISDQWQPPAEIPWAEFCVRVPEREINSIPVLLHHLEGKATKMGKIAQKVFADYFAPNVFLDRLLISLLSNYTDCSFTTEATLRRVWRAIGWREFRSLCYEVRSRVLRCPSDG